MCHGAGAVMANSSILTDYLGQGPAAARPGTLNIASTALGFFYEDDTTSLTLWNGTEWVTIVTGQAASAAGTGIAINAGTVSLAPISPSTLLGNSGTGSAVPGTVTVGSNLTLESGTLAVSPLPAGELFGNPGTAVGPMQGITVGSGLTLSPTGTLTNTGALGTIAADSLLGNSGTVSATPSAVAVGAGLSFVDGTLTASGTTGVTSLVVDASAFLNGGTITTTGTISSPTLAAQSLIGNSNTIGAAASAIAVGANLTLSGGTLSATAGSANTSSVLLDPLSFYGTSPSSTSFAWKGQSYNFNFGTVVVSSIAARFSTLAVGGTYQAAIFSISESPTTIISVAGLSIPIVASSTSGPVEFNFTSPITLGPGTFWSFVAGRIDATGTTALEISEATSSSFLTIPATVGFQTRIASTSIVAGETYDSNGNAPGNYAVTPLISASYP
jgi:Repeat of unknown function (DUF5907)